MNIKVNTDNIIVGDKISVSGLISFLEIKSLDGMAIAVNQQVIPKDKWDDFHLNENDSVLIIRATQGG
jgi:sulfur carrier protein